MYIQTILENLTDEEIISLLEHYGAETRKVRNKEIIFTSICHNSESSKLYYYKESHIFKCWSNCGSIGDLVELLVHINNYEKGDAIKEIKSFFSISSTPTLRRGFRTRKKYERPNISDVEIELLESPSKPYIYTMFKCIPLPEWEEEYIDYKSLQVFDIRYNFYNQQIIIPHFCHYRDKTIVGIRVRNSDEYTIEHFGKYSPMYSEGNLYNHPLSQTLYGLHISKHSIRKYKKVQVFEGEKACLQSYTAFGDNTISVSLCGSNCSIMQKKILIDLEIEEWIWCMDKQYSTKEEEIEWHNKIEKMSIDLIEMGIKVTTVWDNLENGLLKHKDSPLDKGRDIFKQLIRNRREIL
ncbi:MAG: CHC2 zinc finger domain-containing protein [Paraclostridium sp.]